MLPKKILKNLKKDAYVLSLSGYNAELMQLFKLGYTHLYALGDGSIYDNPHYEKIKYLYGKTSNTHFPDSFFDFIYATKLEDISLPEAERILTRGGTLLIKEIGNFKWGTFQTHKKKNKAVKHINIVLPTLGKFEGIAHTTSNMVRNLNKLGIKVDLYKTIKEAPEKYPTIVEYESSLDVDFTTDRKLIIELHNYTLTSVDISLKRIITDWNYTAWFTNSIIEKLKTNPRYFLWLGNSFLHKTILPSNTSKVLMASQKDNPNYILLARSNELAEAAKLRKYYLMPHCNVESPKNQPKLAPNVPLRIGSFGFAAHYKDFQSFCEVAIRLNIPAILLLSINHLQSNAIKQTRGYAEELKEQYDGKGKLTVKIGTFPEAELRKLLAPCTHLMAFQHEVFNVSSSMRLMVSLGKPVIANKIYQSREAQVIRADPDEITIEFLEATRNRLTNMDDGTKYLTNMLNSYEK